MSQVSTKKPVDFYANDIEQARIELGYNVRHFAVLLDATAQTIYDLEAGKRAPSFRMAQDLERITGKTIQELYKKSWGQLPRVEVQIVQVNKK